jgi:acyl dehydratase
MTRVDFRPTGTGDQAGIWIFNGLQTLDARLYSSVDGAGNKVVGLSYKTYRYEVANPPTVGDTVVWLKLVRVNHSLTGFCSADGYQWTSVGGIDVADMDGLQPDYNAWTGNRQGLFVQGKPADFDFYIYRDAYTPILAECPANQYGTAVAVQHPGPNSLGDIHDKDWALYAGVEFGNQEYPRRPDSLEITASCAFSGGVVEAWLDAIDTGTKIAECTISNTGDWSTYRTFTTGVLAPVTGTHDLYLRFRGTDPGNLFLLRWLMFLDGSGPHTAVRDLRSDHLPGDFLLEQNYPNPFNPGTTIRYSLPVPSPVTLSVFNTLGQRVAVLETGEREAGFHDVAFNASGLSSGPYFYRLQTGRLAETRTMLLMK